MQPSKLLLKFLIALPLFIYGIEASALCDRIFLVGSNTDSINRTKEGVNRISIDILKEIKMRTNCVYTERLISFARAAEELRFNRIDIFAFAFSNPEWESFSRQLPIYSVSRLLLIDKKHYHKKLTIPDYLKNPKIKFGSLSGGSFFFQPEELEPLIKAKRVVFDSFPDGLIDLFEEGKLNAVFTSPVFLNRFKKQYKIDEKAMVLIDPKVKLEVSLFLSKKRVSDKEVQIFANAIKNMKKDGTLKKIILKYISQEDFDRFYIL